MNITTLVNDKSMEETKKNIDETPQCARESRFTIVKILANKVNSRFTEVFSEKNDDKDSWDIDIVYDKKIKPLCEAFTIIQDSSPYLYFIEQYTQDFKQLYKKLNLFISVTSNTCIDDYKNPITIAKLATTLNNNNIQHLIQSFQTQFDYAKLYFDNPYALKFIEKNYTKQKDIINLAKAIGFYSILHKNVDKALAFCKQLSHFIRTKRCLISIPDIIKIISNLDKDIKLDTIENKTAQPPKTGSKLKNDKKDTNDLNNDSFKNLDKQHIDIPKPQQIQAITQPLDVIKDSDDSYSSFIGQYKQDFQQLNKLLKPLIIIALDINKKDNKNPIVIAKLATALKNNDIQHMIQSFQSQVNYAELYFNNPQKIEIIEKKHYLGDIIKLVKAIGFYAVLYDKADKALVFCQQLSQFIREKRGLVSIPDISNTISNINKNFSHFLVDSEKQVKYYK